MVDFKEYPAAQASDWDSLFKKKKFLLDLCQIKGWEIKLKIKN
jgi:hypothetical protein